MVARKYLPMAQLASKTNDLRGWLKLRYRSRGEANGGEAALKGAVARGVGNSVCDERETVTEGCREGKKEKQKVK